jgi:hypothetical protein
MKRLPSKLTYANVISTLALFLVLAGGTAFAAKQMLPKNSVGTKQIKNNAITGAKIKNGAISGSKVQLSSLGTVPSAVTATTAAKAATATTAENATNATHAGNADTVGGKSASSFAPASAEPVHIVGDPGQVPFGAGWERAGVEMKPGFWKDPFGTVHLQGQAGRVTGTNDIIFTLPPGFRTTEEEFFVVYPSGGEGVTTIDVAPDGSVELFSFATGGDGFVGLGNIAFRAAGS